MNKEHYNKKIRSCALNMITTLVLLVALILMLSSSSFAWFAFSDNVNGNGLSVNTKEEGFRIMDVKYYGITEIDDSEYIFDNSILTKIPRFDVAQIGNSPYKPALLMAITYFYIDSTKTYQLNAICDSLSDNNETITLNYLISDDNYLSNVVQFRTATVSGQVATASEKCYKFLNENISNNSFVSATKNNKINNLLTIPAGQTSGTLYFIIEYNAPLVKIICNERTNNQNINDLIYKDDISLSIIEA